MARPGSTTILGRGKCSAAHAESERIVDDGGKLRWIQLGVAADVRNAVSATDIELSQDHAVRGANVGHRRDHPVDDFVVQGGVGDLRPDMAMQPDQVQQWLAEHAFHGLRGMPTGQREAELLISDPGGHCGVSVNVDIGGDADQALVAAGVPRTPGRRFPSVSPPPSDRRRPPLRHAARRAISRCRAARSGPGRRPPASAVGQLAAGAHIDAEMLLATQRATVVVSSDFAAYTISASDMAARYRRIRWRKSASSRT